MDTFSHNLHTLFDQLGLPSSDRDIERFIKQHGRLAQKIPLHQASFWNASQSRFIREALEEDSDWAEVVDDLNARLHS